MTPWDLWVAINFKFSFQIIIERMPGLNSGLALAAADIFNGFAESPASKRQRIKEEKEEEKERIKEEKEEEKERKVWNNSSTVLL